MPDNQSLPHLTESGIANYGTEQSFQRGKDYYGGGAIINPIWQGITLRLDKPTIC